MKDLVLVPKEFEDAEVTSYHAGAAMGAERGMCFFSAWLALLCAFQRRFLVFKQASSIKSKVTVML